MQILFIINVSCGFGIFFKQPVHIKTTIKMPPAYYNKTLATVISIVFVYIYILYYEYDRSISVKCNYISSLESSTVSVLAGGCWFLGIGPFVKNGDRAVCVCVCVQPNFLLN